MEEIRVVLITGATGGLGFEIAKALYSSATPYAVYLCGRSLAKAEDAVQLLKANAGKGGGGSLTPLAVDVTADASIAAAFKVVEEQHGRLDALANNAGAWLDNHTADGSMSLREVWSQSWDVNVVGAHAMTLAFAPLLVKSSAGRVLFTTSDTASLAESENPKSTLDQPYAAGWPKPPATPFVAYRCAKVGVNMLTREWRKVLLNDGVRVFAVSPGFMATNLGGQSDMLKSGGGGDPAASADFVRRIIDGERDNDEGKAIRSEGLQLW